MNELVKELGPPKASSGKKAADANGQGPPSDQAASSGCLGSVAGPSPQDLGRAVQFPGGGILGSLLLGAVVALLALLLISTWIQISAIRQLEWTMQQALAEVALKAAPSDDSTGSSIVKQLQRLLKEELQEIE